MRFKNLPIIYKQALLEYCYTWAATFDDIESFYKDTRFEIETISSTEAKKRCMAVNSFGFDSFEDYHAAYMGDDIQDYGDSIYPLIIGNDGEWLDDGWHRFHSYIHFYPTRDIPTLKIKKE